MAASKNDICRWFNDGVKIEATHMIVICDEFDWEDFPVYVKKNENVREVYENYCGKDMQRVMEVYSYRHSLETQLSEDRAFHFD